MLVWLSMPVVVLITLQATVAKAYANWAVTAYVAGTILAVWLLYRLWPKGLRLSLTINGIASLLFPLATIFPQQLLLPNGDELMKRYLGRAEVSREAAALANQAGTDIIVTDNRDMVADLFYTLRDASYRIYARAPAGLPESYYEQGIRPARRDRRQGAFPDRRSPGLRGRNARSAEELAADRRLLQGQDALYLQSLGHLPGTLRPV